jgi:segregation and condensation protein B
MDKYPALIEAILFYESDIVTIDNLSKITSIQKSKLKDIMNVLIEEYKKDVHGLQIVEVAEGYSFQIKKEVYPEIRELYKIKPQNKLSKMNLTVLSIIAYKQPITKNELEEIRGISCEASIKKLLEVNYIQIVGRKEVVGKPLLYGTTVDFLKHFNLKSIEDLPTINELKSDEFDVSE